MEKSTNLALAVLKKVYSQGDDYSSSETETRWTASYSNDYPLQHGAGWTLEIEKKDLSFNAHPKKAARHYLQKIKEEIEKLKNT